MNFYAGRKVILNQALTVPGEPYQVARTWKERLFTRPWRPLKTTRTVVPQVPSREVIMTADVIVMHPAVWKEVEAAIERREAERAFLEDYRSPILTAKPFGGIDWGKMS